MSTKAIGVFHYDTYTIDLFKTENNGIIIYIFNHSGNPSLIEKLYGKEEEIYSLVFEAIDIIWEDLKEQYTKETIT